MPLPQFEVFVKSLGKLKQRGAQRRVGKVLDHFFNCDCSRYAVLACKFARKLQLNREPGWQRSAVVELRQVRIIHKCCPDRRVSFTPNKIRSTVAIRKLMIDVPTINSLFVIRTGGGGSFCTGNKVLRGMSKKHLSLASFNGLALHLNSCFACLLQIFCALHFRRELNHFVAFVLVSIPID